ncbi:hypothetical protein [Micromonospora sp. NPDC023956]|uniref:hypothetical protein n=1 Tax=Micromonospora sp. NPDC023956 TaxID=3155722 RepID=UPI0033DFC42C
MIPTLLLVGLLLGRWWKTTLLLAAVGWPTLLVATGVLDVGRDLGIASALAVVNAGVGVLVAQGLYRAFRELRKPAATE